MILCGLSCLHWNAAAPMMLRLAMILYNNVAVLAGIPRFQLLVSPVENGGL